MLHARIGARREGFCCRGQFAHAILLVVTTRWGKWLPVDAYRCLPMLVDTELVALLTMLICLRLRCHPDLT